jgi:hypothetical protein
MSISQRQSIIMLLPKPEKDTKYREEEIIDLINVIINCMVLRIKRLIKASLFSKNFLEMTFKNGKSPGTDGLPAEFYKIFWNDVIDLVIDSYQYTYDLNDLLIV